MSSHFHHDLSGLYSLSTLCSVEWLQEFVTSRDGYSPRSGIPCALVVKELSNIGPWVQYFTFDAIADALLEDGGWLYHASSVKDVC